MCVPGEHERKAFRKTKRYVRRRRSTTPDSVLETRRRHSMREEDQPPGEPAIASGRAGRLGGFHLTVRKPGQR